MQLENTQSLNVTAPQPISYCELVSENNAQPPARLWQLLDAIRPSDLNWAEWSRRARVSTSYFQDLKKGKTPSIDRLTRILGAIGMTLSDFHALESERDGAPILRVDSPRAAFIAPGDPRDVPMLVTAQAADFEVSVDGAMQFAEQIDVHLDEVIDMVRRPPALRDNKAAYALTVRGMSMKPKFEDGDPIYVDPEQRPAIGDIVIVQLMRRDSDGDGEVVSVLIKELVRRTADYIGLEQYNPPLRFRLTNREIYAIHRWKPWREMVSF